MNAVDQNIARAIESGRATYASLVEMIEALRKARDDEDDDAIEQAKQAIHEDPLSVTVRDGWRQPGAPSEGAEEYEILLSTGGPAVRIYGALNQYDAPETAELQCQDWFTPWTRVHDCEEALLLEYAQCFYFGG